MKTTYIALIALLLTFLSLPLISAEPANITGLEAVSINATEYIIYWNTTEETNCTFLLGIEPGIYSLNYSNVSFLSNLSNHNITLSNLTDNTTYFYRILFWNILGESNETEEYNFTTDYLDIYAPIWSNPSVFPLSNSTYSPSAQYIFNLTWTDYNLSQVFIEHNFTGPLVNDTLSWNNSNIQFFYNYTPLAAGNHSWRMYAYDEAGNFNVSDFFVYSVLKANSSVNLTMNGSFSNFTMTPLQPGDILILNVTLLEGEENASLYVNGTLYNTTADSRRLDYNFTVSGTYEITVNYTETQNYSFSKVTLYVNVEDTSPPEITINSPANNSLLSTQNFYLNFTTNEVASCNFSTGSAINTSLSQNQTQHIKLIELDDDSYNISINCSDLSGYISETILNIAIDSEAPLLNITYPVNGAIYQTELLGVNVSVSDSDLDKVWFTLDYNSTKNITSFIEGNNSINITFNPGKNILSFGANDTAGNLVNSNISFYVNSSINATLWEAIKDEALSNVTSIELFNSTWNRQLQAVPVDQTFSVQINLTSISLDIYNFTGINALWEAPFTIEDSSSYFVFQIISNIGAMPVDYVYVRNMSLFVNDTSDYYGKIKLPHNLSYYGNIIYYCSDSLDACTRISACLGSYTETNQTACYNDTAENVFVYVPHFSAVFSINDTVAPAITITYPANNSVLNESYSNSLSFTTNENSTCAYAINSGSFRSVSGTTSFSTTFNATANGGYNLSINCSDVFNNSRLSTIAVTINDTTAPVIDMSYSRSTTAIALDFTTDEPSNHTILFSSNANDTETEFTLEHYKQFSGLSEGTTYSYTITLCDWIGNCENTTGSVSTTTTTTSTTSTSNTDSTSTPTGTVPTTTPTYKKTSQVWTNPRAGEYTMSIPSVEIAFTSLIFTLKTNITGIIQITVENRDLPSFIPGLEDTAYQYLKVDKTVIEDNNLSNTIIKFRVDKSWLRANNINQDTVSLYRYTTAWEELPTEKTTEDSSYSYYESETPGFSYFGIRGEQLELPVINPGTQTQETTGDVIRQIAEVTPDEEDKKPGSFIIPLIFLGIIMAAVGGFLIYQRTASVTTDAELRELRTYVEKCISEGIALDHIKEALLKSGWAENIVGLVMHDVHLPIEDTDKIEKYIQAMRKEGKQDQEIKDNLVKVGWQEEIIADLFLDKDNKTKKSNKKN